MLIIFFNRLTPVFYFRRCLMPYVNVMVAGRLDGDQKKKIAEGITGILHDVAGKKPDTTYVVFSEVERDNWAVGGKLLSEKS